MMMMMIFHYNTQQSESADQNEQLVSDSILPFSLQTNELSLTPKPPFYLFRGLRRWRGMQCIPCEDVSAFILNATPWNAVDPS